MARKRANGEGSVSRRADGRYMARLSYVDESTGKTLRQTFYGATHKEAKAKLTAAQQRIATGAPVRDATATLATWCTQWIKSSLAASDRKPTTKATYDSLLRCHVIEQPLGQVQLDRLKPTDVEAWVVAMRQRGLSPATISRAFQVIRVCLASAVRDGLIARNPLEVLRQPKIPRHEERFLTQAEVAGLLTQLSEQTRPNGTTYGGRFLNIVSLIAFLGLRKGEALALRWSDVDTGRKTLRIAGTLSRVDGELLVTEPKTETSRRVLTLTEPVAAILKTQRVNQAADRLRAGDQWQETGLVFTSETGKPMDPRNVLRAVTVAAAKAKLGNGVNVHTLRHSAGFLMAEAGVPLKTISYVMGHSDIRMTADRYGHVNDDSVSRGLVALASALGR